jgi:hypothetical protein
MGHGYYGSRLKDQERHEERFAWWPTRSSFNKKRIWLTKYHIVNILYDDTGRPPIKGSSWPLIYTKNEYLMMLLKDSREQY